MTDEILIIRNCGISIVILLLTCVYVEEWRTRWLTKHRLPHPSPLFPIYLLLIILMMVFAVIAIILVNMGGADTYLYMTEVVLLSFSVVPTMIIPLSNLPRTIVRMILHLMHGFTIVCLFVCIPLFFTGNGRSYAMIASMSILIIVFVRIGLCRRPRIQNIAFKLHMLFLCVYVLMLLIQHANILRDQDPDAMILVRSYVWPFMASMCVIMLYWDNYYWYDLCLNKDKFNTILAELASFDSSATELEFTDIFIEYPRIRFLERCGAGARSIVYRGKFENNVVALKIYVPQEITNKVARRWAREVSISILLDHPNIVHCYGICIVPPRLIVIMEYCDDTLKEYVRRRLTYIQIVTIMLDISRAIAFLHRRGIVHRDIKSTNIMIKDGVAKLIDFSESRHVVRSMMTVVGTPQYIAPEILQTNTSYAQYTAKVDIFSAGLVFWEIMHNGQSIYPGTWSVRRILQEIGNGYRPNFHPSIDKKMIALVTSMWSEDPAGRPSATALVEFLEDYYQRHFFS